MPELDYFIVDVFTQTPLAGNPLAVVMNTVSLTTERMQAIARELGELAGADVAPRVVFMGRIGSGRPCAALSHRNVIASRSDCHHSHASARRRPRRSRIARYSS